MVIAKWWFPSSSFSPQHCNISKSLPSPVFMCVCIYVSNLRIESGYLSICLSPIYYECGFMNSYFYMAHHSLPCVIILVLKLSQIWSMGAPQSWLQFIQFLCWVIYHCSKYTKIIFDFCCWLPLGCLYVYICINNAIIWIPVHVSYVHYVPGQS